MPLHIFTQNPGIVLSASIIVLFFGPLIHALFKSNKNILRLIDGFTLIVIIELVVIHLIPHTITDIGWPALVLALFGVLFPTFIENRMKQSVASQAHIFTLILAMIAMALHTFTDGFVLLNPTLSHGHTHTEAMLPLAIILHRLPVGLAIWWLLKPAYGTTKALLMLTIMSAATVAGFYFGQNVVGFLDHKYFGLFEALIAGSLLHVVFHRHDAFEVPHAHRGWQWASGIGAVLGMGFIYFIGLSDVERPLHTHVIQPATVFLSLALESAPALVFAYIASGLIQGFFPEASVMWMRRGTSFTKAVKGMAFGLPLPICSCGVVPIYRTLMKQGVPLSAGLAFFVATPELGLDAILISIPLLGGEMTAIRVVCAAIVALVIGWQVGNMFKKSVPDVTISEGAEKKQKPPFWQRLKDGMNTGFIDVVDHTGPWIILGLIIAALAHPYLTESDIIKSIPDYLQVPFFAILGMPVYVCATGITPLIAVLIYNGVSPGAAIAFLLTGPATNITTFGILSQLHGRKLAITFAAGMAILSIGLGYLVNLFFIDAASSVTMSEFTDDHELNYKMIFLVILAGIYLMSLLRQGPRFLINQIVAFESQEHHKH